MLAKSQQSVVVVSMAAIKTKLKLLKMFDDYNKKYWNSSLPRVNIVIKDIPKTYGEYWCPDNKRRLFKNI